ncbi:hypothetical protein ABH959_005800, partial [Bacillus sp. RC51]
KIKIDVHVVCFVQFSKNYLVAHLRLPYVNIFVS